MVALNNNGMSGGFMRAPLYLDSVPADSSGYAKDDFENFDEKCFLTNHIRVSILFHQDSSSSKTQRNPYRIPF